MKTILDALRTAETELKISDTSGTMFTSVDVYQELYRYQTFQYCCRLAQTTDDWKDCWSSWLSVRLPDIRRMYDAYYAQYDPVSNYDMIEIGADGQRIDKSETVVTPTGKQRTTNTVSRQGLNSSSYVAADQVQSDTEYLNSYKTTSETTPTNTQTADFDGDTMTGLHTASEHRLKRSGNIGVTTSQQMIQSELELRKTNMLRNLIREFVYDNCFLTGGD